MTTSEVAHALEDWGAEVTGASADWRAPETITDPLPLVVASVQRIGQAGSYPDFPARRYQQTRVRRWVAALELLVDPRPIDESTEALYTMVDQLGEAIRADETCGGRVSFVSPDWEAELDPAIHEFEEGLTARVVTLTVTVGEQLSA